MQEHCYSGMLHSYFVFYHVYSSHCKRPLNSTLCNETHSENTTCMRKLNDKREQKIGWDSHLLGMINSFFLFQQMTAVVDKRCWFRGQIKPWTGKIMCLWSINTDTRCTGFTLKLSGPANGPLCAFQLSSTNHFHGLLLKAALDSEYGFSLGTLPRQWTD